MGHPNPKTLQRELDVARGLALEAGKLILEVYRTPFEVVEKPEGGGPVTLADERANTFIVDGLRKAFPGDGVVAEESVDASEMQRSSRCWFVDPMDGTAEFVERNGMFAVQIGLSIDGEAAVGVVYAPVSGKLYSGIVGGACRLEEGGASTTLHVAEAPLSSSELRLVVSRSHKSKKTELIRERLGIRHVTEHGSVGLKCGLLAEAMADVYLHPSNRSYRWDSCGPEAILRAAGGILTDFAAQPYRYDGPELRNVRGILACSAGAFPMVRDVAAEVARDSGLI